MLLHISLVFWHDLLIILQYERSCYPRQSYCISYVISDICFCMPVFALNYTPFVGGYCKVLNYA